MDILAWLQGLQKSRDIEFITPFGDTLLFRRMTAHQQLGRPFRFDLEFLTLSPELPLEQLLGQPVAVRLSLRGLLAAVKGGEEKYFHGLVHNITQAGSVGDYALYQVEIVPWLQLLDHASDCRIFQNISVPEIVKTVFRDHGFSDFEQHLTYDYAPREYCVQYRETDLAFVNRLLEEEGITYYFRHEKERHFLVLSDSIAGYERLGPVQYLPPDKLRAQRLEIIRDWRTQRRVATRNVATQAFNFENPRANLLVTGNLLPTHAPRPLERYDYPGKHTERQPGDDEARRQAEALAAQTLICNGEANIRGLSLGQLFTLTGHPRRDQWGEYQLTSVTHQICSDDYMTAGQQDEPEICTVAFSAIPSQQPFRTPIETPKPIVQGAQTAIVTGPEGEEIYCDKYGRVKAKFHWDRKGPQDANSSCWIRVASDWAGQNWGQINLPRVGQEVVVEFLEGDPDRPLITGRVHNALTMPPSFSGTGQLPANRALSGIKTKSYKGGQYNELLFDDTTGEERVKLSSEHAKTQLNQGFLTHPRNNGTAEPRGEGFELRTDAHGVIRATHGLLLTTQAQPGANGKQLDRQELIAQLEAALELAKSLGDNASHHQMEKTDTKPQHTLTEAIKDWEHGSNTAKQASGGGQPVLAVSAPAGIALSTPQSTTLHSGENLDLICEQDTQHTSAKRWLVNAGTALHQFVAGVAGKVSMKFVAARGKVAIEAHSDDIEVTADKSVKVAAANGQILVAAKEHITLTSGGGYIKLSGGNIEIHAPGKISIKGASYDLAGGASMNIPLPSLPKLTTPSTYSQQMHVAGLFAGMEQSVAGMPYKVMSVDGKVLTQGSLVGEGQSLRIYTDTPQEFDAYVGDGHWEMIEEWAENDVMDNSEEEA